MGIPDPIRILAATASTALLSGLAGAQDGAIELFAGETIFREGTRVSVTQLFQYKDGLLAGSEAVFDPTSERFSESRTVLGVNHGIARNWSLSALLPIVERESSSTAGTSRSSGVGDLAVVLKNSFHRVDWDRSAWHTAWLAGVETPTGVTDERDGGVLLSPSMQPGSGSWDPFVGVATTLDLDLWRFDAVALYEDDGEGDQDHDPGERLRLSLSGKYRWWHEVYPGPTAASTIGLEWSHQASAELGGVHQPDSGGETLLLKLATGWHPRPDLDLGISLKVPLHEDYDGTQLGLDSSVQLALGWRF